MKNFLLAIAIAIMMASCTSNGGNHDKLIEALVRVTIEYIFKKVFPGESDAGDEVTIGLPSIRPEENPAQAGIIYLDGEEGWASAFILDTDEKIYPDGEEGRAAFILDPDEIIYPDSEGAAALIAAAIRASEAAAIRASEEALEEGWWAKSPPASSRRRVE